MKIKVLIVDDHELFRDGLMAILRNHENIQLIGNVTSAEDAINLLENDVPDVILMDVMMSGMTGFEATRIIKEQYPNVKVLIISSEVTKELVSTGIKCGIDGYIPKHTGKVELLEALIAVHKGQKFFNNAITSLVFENFYQSELTGTKKLRKVKSNELTKRENEVLELVAEGKSNQEVADQLFISIKTVETHKMNILLKLGLKNTAELVKYAIKHNIISID